MKKLKRFALPLLALLLGVVACLPSSVLFGQVKASTGTFDGAGPFTGVGKLSTSNATLALEQTGGTTATKLTIQGTGAPLGAMLENEGSTDLTDLGFKADISGAVDYLRFEHRSGQWLNSSDSNGEIQILDNAGATIPVAMGASGISTFHVKGASTTPTKAAGTGAGTSPTITVTGSDLAGKISVTVGSSPTGSNAAVVTVTFASAFSSAPYVTLTPANAAAAALSGATQVYVVPATGNFVLTSGSTALTATSVYVWNYMVIQ